MLHRRIPGNSHSTHVAGSRRIASKQPADGPIQISLDGLLHSRTGAAYGLFDAAHHVGTIGPLAIDGRHGADDMLLVPVDEGHSQRRRADIDGNPQVVCRDSRPFITRYIGSNGLHGLSLRHENRRLRRRCVLAGQPPAVCQLLLCKQCYIGRRGWHLARQDADQAFAAFPLAATQRIDGQALHFQRFWQRHTRLDHGRRALSSRCRCLAQRTIRHGTAATVVLHMENVVYRQLVDDAHGLGRRQHVGIVAAHMQRPASLRRRHGFCDDFHRQCATGRATPGDADALSPTKGLYLWL